MDIEKAAKAAGIFERVTPKGMEQWHADSLRALERFAQIIRNQALEDAAKVCEEYEEGSGGHKAIRAMKEE